MMLGMKHQTFFSQTNKAVKVSKLALDVIRTKVIYRNQSKDFVDQKVGKLTYDTIKTLGPTFVKIGQFISTRSDIFGAAFTSELKELQDNVTAMSYDEVKPTLELLSPHFIELHDKPLAAASIGQVHYGVLNDNTKVAVKLKRVGIDETIDLDFKMLLALINFMKCFVINRQITEIEISLKEYYNLLLEEIDFKNEVSNMKMFADKTKNISYIKVPTPVDSLCTNDIIVMEYVPSVKADDVKAIQSLNFNTRKISEKLLESFFTQIVEYGFVHIDPHPGNVGITAQGQIVYYDYGMFVALDGVMKVSLKNLFLAMYDRDIEEVCDILIKLNIITVDPSKVPSFRKFIASFLTYLDSLDIDNFKISYLDRIDQSEMQFLITSKMILLLRGITILEGVCKNLNPGFNYREILDPFISDFIIDIDYIERRGSKDISRFRQAPDKLISSEISLNLVETDVINLKSKLINNAKTMRYTMIAVLSVLLLQTDQSIESRCISLMAFLYVLVNK